MLFCSLVGCRLFGHFAGMIEDEGPYRLKGDMKSSLHRLSILKPSISPLRAMPFKALTRMRAERWHGWGVPSKKLRDASSLKRLNIALAAAEGRSRSPGAVLSL